MPVLGINLETPSIRYTVLDGKKSNPQLVEKDRHLINSTNSIPELMDWYETTFTSILNRIKPLAISYKLNLNPKKAQMPLWVYPYGILNALSYKLRISISEYTPANFVPSKFGFPKTTDLFSKIDEIFGEHPPYWDKAQKYSLLAAWIELK